MKNIYLVQVVDSYGPNKFLPLAIAYQWLYARNNNWNLKDTLIEKTPPVDYVKTMDNPSMVAMSSYVWNWEYNQALAREIKKVWPDCVIVVGGPQIHKRDAEFFNKFPMFDLAVHGEGERAFKEILARDNNYDGIPHVQTRTHMPKMAARVLDISDIPSPILEGFYEPIMAKYPVDTMWQVTFETLRGCPYHCAFCDIGDSYWNKLTLFDIDRVKSEIDWMGRNRIEYVSVCDSNWGLLERDKEITQYVIDTKTKYGYPRWWDATWAKNNLERNFEIAMLDREQNANIFKGVTFALQSFNDATLNATERFNVDNLKIKKYLDLYKKENIPTYSELIWPMPEETLDSLKSGIQQLIDLGQDDFLMVHPLVITNNATMGNSDYQQRWGIKTKTVPLDTFYLNPVELEKYIIEYTDAVYQTHTVSWQDNIEGNMYAWLLITFYYYGWGHYLAKYMRTQGIVETLFFDKLLTWIKQNKNTFLHKEYSATLECILNTFEKSSLWGRQVLGSNDIYWDYRGASSVIFHQNRNALSSELTQFLIDVFALQNAQEIIDLNLLACKDKNTVYPVIAECSQDLAKKMFGINSTWLQFDHTDQTVMQELRFFRKAYHHNRKLKYWQCQVTAHDKKL